MGRRLISNLKKTRFALKSWRRQLLPRHLAEANCKYVISFLDLIEEHRQLSRPEFNLRHVLIKTLRRAIRSRVDHWKIRSKIKFAIDGDENTKYFHICASNNLRNNKISVIEQNGVEFSNHSQKTDILTSYYTQILGTTSNQTWRFNLHDFYQPIDHHLRHLDAPFTADEITDAFLGMNATASSGPDGFGPAFYRKFWPTVKPKIIDLFQQFHNGHVDLDGLNRAYMVLIPKKDNARTPDAFRPISLQNCPIKAIAKALANRLQQIIPILVNPNQTGFIRGRCISENFVFAADILNCCHKRKAPTLVVKLDFRKAFDSINWDSLLKILNHRGFPSKFISWIQSLLQTGKTAVLVNGVPGNWINCKKGLRQGDPLSPYLFITVADVLQQLLNSACGHGLLAHPLLDNTPCPVLQYADDTLIIVRATPTAAQNLKEILDNFALATGLSINFDKTTLVPMNTSTNLATAVAATLGTQISSFPQTYLGLPLSDTKLPASAFQPIIDTCDRYLAGWCANLLSKGGRLVLLSAVLDALPTYFMSSFLIPASVLKTIDARRRAFFWTAEETCTGSQCLIAWDKLCTPTTRGGLGAKNLKAQNICLLLKFCYKFLHSQNLPWKQWILTQTTTPFAATSPSYLTKILAKHLDTLLQITTCIVNNGRSVLFWHDKWLLPETLATAYPALYSHHTQPHALVCDILQNDISAGLRCRLTAAASQQLASLSTLLQELHLNDEQDTRRMLDGSPFSVKAAYTLMHGQPQDPDASHIWRSKVPKKIKVFGWLLHHDRINTRANLMRKHIITSQECPRCQAPTEDRSHLFFHCPASAAIWRRLAISPNANSFPDIWSSPLPPNLPSSIWNSVALTILWKIWDARNAKVFRAIDQPTTSTLSNIVSDFTLWSHRFKQAELKVHADLWRDYLSLCNQQNFS